PCRQPDRTVLSGVGPSPTADRFFSAASSVGSSGAVSPRAASWIGAAKITPVSRSTACSGLEPRSVEPSFILAILASGLARPIVVRQLLAFALAVEPDQVVDRRRLDAALIGHPRQHLAIGLATVAAHNRPQR